MTPGADADTVAYAWVGPEAVEAEGRPVAAGPEGGGGREGRTLWAGELDFPERPRSAVPVANRPPCLLGARCRCLSLTTSYISLLNIPFSCTFYPHT